jgi:hypothetical protein
MIKRVEKQRESQRKNSGNIKSSREVESLNEKGIKVNDRWYNFSKFLNEKPADR